MDRKPKRKRDIQIPIRLSEKEEKELEQKMQAANMTNREEFIRILIKNAEIKVIDVSYLDEAVRLFGTVARNINQVAIRCNESRNVYEADVLELKNEILDIREKVSGIKSKLIQAFKG